MSLRNRGRKKFHSRSRGTWTPTPCPKVQPFELPGPETFYLMISGCGAIDTWWHHEMETFSVLLAIVWGIHPSPVNSPHKGQWHGALMFSLICVWINGWVNNRGAGDLRHHRTHYDVIVMYIGYLFVKVTFEMLTVHGQQHSFLTDKWMFLFFFGTWTPNLRIHAKWSTIWGGFWLILVLTRTKHVHKWQHHFMKGLWA